MSEISKPKDLRTKMMLQIILVRSPFHLAHLKRETGRSELPREELLFHFAQHKNARGRSFASLYAKLFARYEEIILSQKNIHYAGEHFKHSPTTVEAALYYFAYRHRFGLTLQKLPELMAKM